MTEEDEIKDEEKEQHGKRGRNYRKCVCRCKTREERNDMDKSKTITTGGVRRKQLVVLDD